MCDVTVEDFLEYYPAIETSLHNAEFISIDLEFSGLPSTAETQHSRFDENRERYQKARINMGQVIPMQLGLTAFIFCPERTNFVGETYSFYLRPASFKAAGIDKTFHTQISSINFLKANKFDCIKWYNHAIPYLNKSEVEHLQKKLEGDFYYKELPLIDASFSILNECHQIISGWYNEAEENESMEIELIKHYVGNRELTYLFHKALRESYENLETFESGGKFFVRKRSEFDYAAFVTDINEDTVQTLKGFSHVFDLLVSLKKPLVGHNLYMDLLVLINNFHEPLPETYRKYKNVVHELFPAVYDTKTLYYKYQHILPDGGPKSSSLENLFNYFTTCPLRNGPTIEFFEESWKFHDAGWDSYCTGYIFIKMTSMLLCKNVEDFPREMLEAVADVKNCINVIMGATQFIRLDSDDPAPKHIFKMEYVIKSLIGQEINLEKMGKKVKNVKFRRLCDHKVIAITDNANELTAYVKTIPCLTIKQHDEEDDEEELTKALSYNQPLETVRRLCKYGVLMLSHALLSFLEEEVFTYYC